MCYVSVPAVAKAKLKIDIFGFGMIVCVLVAALTPAAFFFGHAFLTKPLSSSVSSAGIRVGLFYYLWYEGEQGKDHWNGAPPDNDMSLAWKVVDTPSDFYNSCSVETIRRHLEWFRDLGIDFLIVSWWGPGSFSDYATRLLFSVAGNESYLIEIAIMVEAYDLGGFYNFTAICDYIDETYVSRYSDVFMKVNGLPLLCFFNDNINMTKDVARRDAIYGNATEKGFAARILGQTSEYVDWWAWPQSGFQQCPEPNFTDGFVGILPRYDDTHIGGNNPTYDASYAEGLYDRQWNVVLKMASEGNVNYVAIYSWNEYHERSQIEPCWDNTSAYADDPYFLFKKTKDYIRELRVRASLRLCQVSCQMREG
jgi:hypothetical protein